MTARPDVFYGAAGYGDATSASLLRVFLWGSGGPNGVVAADPGSLYADYATGNVWSKTSGVGTNTGWTQLAPMGTGGRSYAVSNNTFWNASTNFGTAALAPNTGLPGPLPMPGAGLIVAISAMQIDQSGANPLYGANNITSGSIDYKVAINGATQATLLQLTGATAVAGGLSYAVAAGDGIDLWQGTTNLITGAHPLTAVGAAWVAI